MAAFISGSPSDIDILLIADTPQDMHLILETRICRPNLDVQGLRGAHENQPGPKDTPPNIARKEYLKIYDLGLRVGLPRRFVHNS